MTTKMNFMTQLEIQKFRDQEDTALHEAAYEGDVKKVKALLRNCEIVKNINYRNRLGCSPLRLAATGGHEEVIEELLRHGANPNLCDIKTQTALYVAVKKHFMPSVKMLLKAGANPDGDPRSLCTPIYLGAMDGWLEVIKELVGYGADLNRCQVNLGTFVSTPLYITVAYRHFKCFQFLIRSGANPNTHMQGASQSLYHAAIRHNVDVAFAAELYAFGASIYVKNDKGRLPNQMDQNNDVAKYIATFYEEPRSLMMQSRIQIRVYLGRAGLPNISDLPLPSKIQAYLRHD